jgi:hypothetical protein
MLPSLANSKVEAPQFATSTNQLILDIFSRGEISDLAKRVPGARIAYFGVIGRYLLLGLEKAGVLSLQAERIGRVLSWIDRVSPNLFKRTFGSYALITIAK